MNELQPRAITVLVVLRSGVCTRGRLADILGDDIVQQTEDLLLDMKTYGLIQNAPMGRTAWCLTHDGISWLQAHGVQITDRGLQEILTIYKENSRPTPS